MCRTNTISFSALIRAGPKLAPTARPETARLSSYLLCGASGLDLLAFERPFGVVWRSPALFVESWAVVDPQFGDRLKRIDRERWI